MGENIDWDQIKSKWAAMARRVGADVQSAPLSASERLVRKSSEAVQAAGMIDRLSAVVSDARRPDVAEWRAGPSAGAAAVLEIGVPRSDNRTLATFFDRFR